MYELRLVIADNDQDYIDSFIDFISSKHKNKFYVKSFTNEKSLYEHIDKTDRVDILIIDPFFYREDIDLKKVVAPVVLSAGILPKEIKDFEIISKYQTGDNLVSAVLNIFSEKSNFEIHTKDGSKNTKVFTFFSPSGGTGTSTLAVAAALECVKNNLNVFYLNLERFSSTTAFFNSAGNGQSLSNIMFFLKENSKNLSLKIETSRIIDDTTGIHYFFPPENILDIEDVTTDEIKRLIEQMKKMAYYDVIIADIGNELNNINISLLQKSDYLFYVLSYDKVSKLKFEEMLKGFEILNKRKGLDFIEKGEFILNKCTDLNLESLNNLTLGEKTAFAKIPYINGMEAFDIMYLMDKENPLGNALNQIIYKL
ncbi:AAA family ATPase [Herbivorax sp. ANBcel31]|uniref:AAA family ATPase n=1 Tax=Herbivorax sp. ANBcel31 TaxID=3069754 RepID=UPI0027AFB582|nr:AAA family ATPase [Herbivorax sp. ANBcel31]MDQ2085711.1 AAA family ATPase [Herbivorax sp. ANBcel31]